MLNSSVTRLAAPVFLGLILLTATAHAVSLDAAVYDAVVNGRETRFVKAYGHEFHIKPVKVIRAGDNYVASCQLSHQLRMRKDDQFFCTIVIDKNGVMTEYSERINRGGLSSMVVDVPIKGARTAGSVIAAITRKVGKGRGWEGAARRVVGLIAVHVAKHYGLKPSKPGASAFRKRHFGTQAPLSQAKIVGRKQICCRTKAGTSKMSPSACRTQKGRQVSPASCKSISSGRPAIMFRGRIGRVCCQVGRKNSWMTSAQCRARKGRPVNRRFCNRRSR